MKRILSAAVLSCALSASLLAMPASSAVPKQALIYGDSLTLEARPTIVSLFAPKAGWRVTVKAIPGTALCEYTSTLATDLATIHPYVVSVETHGGNLSPNTGCYNQAIVRDSPEYYAKYQADIHNLFQTVTATGAKVVFIQTPPDYGTADVEQVAINNIALTEAANFHGVSIAKAPRTALAASNKWTATKPCLSTETEAMGCNLTTKKISVRAPDKVHFCSVPYPDFPSWFVGCPVYSSGAYRYGKAIVTATVTPPKPVLP